MFIFSFRMFSYGEFKAEDQEKMLGNLNRKVEDVYRSCIGDNEANIRSVVTMATANHIALLCSCDTNQSINLLKILHSFSRVHVYICVFILLLLHDTNQPHNLLEILHCFSRVYICVFFNFVTLLYINQGYIRLRICHSCLSSPIELLQYTNIYMLLIYPWYNTN